MPSGSKKEDYDPEQYERQLRHSREWKAANRAKIRAYNQKYNERKRREREAADSRS